MTLSGAATAFATASAILGIPAHTEMAAALSLCLDTKTTMVERSAAFEQSGWENSQDFVAAREAFVATGTMQPFPSSSSGSPGT